MFTIKEEVINQTSHPLSLNAYGQITRIGTPQRADILFFMKAPLE